MALLAGLWRKAGLFDFGICLRFAALEEDDQAKDAVERLSKGHCNPSVIVTLRSHQELVDALAGLPGLAGWAVDFRRRYLDLSPVS